MNTLCKTAKRATVVCLVLGILRAFETLSPRKASSIMFCSKNYLDDHMHQLVRTGT